MTNLGHDTGVLTVANGLANLSPTVSAWNFDALRATHVRLAGALPAELRSEKFALVFNDGHTLRFRCAPHLQSGRPVGCQVEFLRSAE